MPRVPKKVADRLSKQLSVFQKVLSEAKKRDVNESDTVTIITDMLDYLFGFDKYTEVTSELAIKGTYCDLAVKIDGAIKYLIEVKAIGLTLKENHLRQAMNYGANHGIPWVVLSNGINWDIYRIKIEGKVVCEHTCSINLLELNPRKSDDIELLFLLCKEGLAKAAIEDFHEHARHVNRFVLAAVIQSDAVLDDLRREVSRCADGAKVTIDEIKSLLPEVLKRDVVEGESAEQARKRVKKSAKKTLRKRTRKKPAADKSNDP